MNYFAKRIIPCLDVKDGRVVKGVNFVGLKDAGDPVEVARRYNEEGADELTFLDITASSDNRDTIVDIVAQVAREIFIPLTVGGGIRKLDDIYKLLNVGCDKVSVNSAAIKRPELIDESAKRFGSQCIVTAIDVKRTGDKYHVFLNGGRVDTGLDAVEWAKEVVNGAEKISEYSDNELLTGKIKWIDIIHPDDKDKTLLEVEELLKKAQTIICVYRIITKKGKIRWVEDRMTSSFYKPENEFRVDGIILDISKQKKADKVLKEALKKNFGSPNKRGKALVEHTSINPNASPHVGRARNALIGDAVVRLLKFAGYSVESHYFEVYTASGNLRKLTKKASPKVSIICFFKSK